MKTYLKKIAVILVVFISGCASSETMNQANHENQSEPDVITDYDRNSDKIIDRNRSARDLTDYLIRVPGIYVQGGGNHVKVTIRGPSSFMLSTDPLFVINGQIVGRDYNRVRNSISVHEIDYVRILRGTDAAIYGSEGANGVILIQMKWNSNEPLID
jgi:outer membrane receptor for ferrienterochelin and colicin